MEERGKINEIASVIAKAEGLKKRINPLTFSQSLAEKRMKMKMEDDHDMKAMAWLSAVTSKRENDIKTSAPAIGKSRKLETSKPQMTKPQMIKSQTSNQRKVIQCLDSELVKVCETAEQVDTREAFQAEKKQKAVERKKQKALEKKQNKAGDSKKTVSC